MSDPPNLKNTLNLPVTPFPIRAGLSTIEPGYLGVWPSLTPPVSGDKASFVLHDGPPYPNGPIHLGHALNKVLKDIVIRSRRMMGFSASFTPGWDCHGLPIETQLQKQLSGSERPTTIPEFRDRCAEFALGYVESQKAEFQRLGVDAQWDTPYLTLTPEYESAVVTAFGQMAENGIVYRGLKPIHWCTHCKTALAEAEIEHKDHRSPSITIQFAVRKSNAHLPEGAHVLVWTTTPWTLPANVAVAAHPTLSYVLIDSDQGQFVVAEPLVTAITASAELTSVQIVKRLLGADLEGIVLTHPIFDRESPLILADFVTSEEGTGFVHIAPGHGVDDFRAGQKAGLPTLMPVNDDGRFDDTVPWAGMAIFDANKAIGEAMQAAGTLLKLVFIKHSYPHCWRCKNPVIFRATEQWFVAMDTPMAHTNTTLRAAALSAIQTIDWVPDWGQNRIESMVKNRPDWCISRQRSWGIPIPAFVCRGCGDVAMTGAVNKAVSDQFLKHGSRVWFEKDADQLLPVDFQCAGCGKRDFRKETDILDVWFESGASHCSVIRNQKERHFPSDLVLEGSDQHRGWFQSSLLIGLATLGVSPFKSALTHGFLVDEKGRKMSKSEGNVVSPQDVVKNQGADILRWWVAHSDYKNDVAVAKTILEQSSVSFGKVRNTLRFLLSNLGDFDPATDAVAEEQMAELDRWILAKTAELSVKVVSAYETYDFHVVTHSIHDFCAVTLSTFYLDVTKDRLYCGAKSSLERRSTQTGFDIVFNTLVRLLAPVLVFTAEDAFHHYRTRSEAEAPTPDQLTYSVHFEEFVRAATPDQALLNRWEPLLQVRESVYQKLEVLRNDKQIKSFLEAKVMLTLPDTISLNDWASFLIVSQVDVVGGLVLDVQVGKAEGDKCGRCWKVLDVNPEGLCDRCSEVVAGVNAVARP